MIKSAKEIVAGVAFYIGALLTLLTVNFISFLFTIVIPFLIGMWLLRACSG